MKDRVKDYRQVEESEEILFDDREQTIHLFIQYFLN